MKIAILGYGSQGKSAYKHWNTSENQITICDGDESTVVPDGVGSQLGANHLQNLDDFDLLIRSPIVHPRQIAEANSNSPNILDKVTTNTNEFFRLSPTVNIVAVTGTKGKGTTSTLITKMLEAAGKRVHLGGNIGIPPLELLQDNIQPDDWVVLELANFQLIDLKHSPHIAVCLMVVPEHLDWHEDMEEYIAAKQQLFINQSPSDIAIYYANNENSESIANASEGELVPYYESPGAYIDGENVTIDNTTVCTTDEIALLGKHNWQNICAAVTAIWQITKDIEAIKSVVTKFSGLPFRIELRRKVNGIKYYNDSFATAAGATIAAMQAISEPKVMIIGGFDRGLDLTELGMELKDLAGGIRKALLIGTSAERTASELRKQGFDNFVISKAKDMPSIVTEATSHAKTGDAVVLSPAFASFDMFKNFEDRGNKFNQAVEVL